jgi:gamma-glutamylcyclotransferase (GGCT)/AIG2-like uncharacterized protein YtfP
LTKHILVYGTLRRKPKISAIAGAENSPLMQGAKFVDEVRVPGYDMYSLGAFPGIKENPANKKGIVGELYEIPDDAVDDLIAHLDYYEGYRPDDVAHSMYLRREVNVSDTPAMIYVYNGTTDEKWIHLIPSGNWRDVQNA